MTSTYAMHCAGRKVGCGKGTEGVMVMDVSFEPIHIVNDRKNFLRKIVPQTNGAAKKRILSIMRCAIHRTINYKRMCSTGKTSIA